MFISVQSYNFYIFCCTIRIRNMDQYTTFYIVRHGETDWNVEHLLQGHQDTPLNETGKEQAASLRTILQNIYFDRIFSSDLLRAKQTAEILALERQLAVVTTSLLKERKFGEFEGKPVSTLRRFDEILQKLSDEEKHAYKFGEDVESDKELAQRMMTFLRETAIRYPGETILVTTHGGVMGAFLLSLGLLTYQPIEERKSIGNTSFLKLETDGIDFFVKETYGIDINKKDI